MSTPAGGGTGSIRPRFAPHVHLRFDARRDRWVVTAPEKLLIPDDIAVEVLRRCNGEATMEEIVADLAREFDAEREVIGRDVADLMRDLSDRGVLVR